MDNYDDEAWSDENGGNDDGWGNEDQSNHDEDQTQINSSSNLKSNDVQIPMQKNLSKSMQDFQFMTQDDVLKRIPSKLQEVKELFDFSEDEAIATMR